PLPWREGVYQQAFHTFKLERRGEYWAFHNHAHGGAGFEFRPQPRTVAEFGERCNWLQTSPESGFVKVTVCHRLQPDHTILSLRGAVLTTVDAAGKSQRVVDSLEEYRELLTGTFGLRLSDHEIKNLWEKV